MARSEKDKYTRANSNWTKEREVNAPISIKYLMVKELTSSLEDGDISKLSVLIDPINEDSTPIKRKIRILDHQKNLIEVLRARLSIAQGLTGNNITMRPNQFRFTRTSTVVLNKSTRNIYFSVMARSEKDKSTRVNSDWTKAREVNEPISIKYLMVKELPSSLEDGDISKLSVLIDMTNEDSTPIKRKIRILDHQKKT